MSDIAISVQDLWKQYRLGQAKSASFRESVGQWFTRSEAEYFWALKELDFEVKRGEAVGIIGKNGAGKSTLLKVLSKITYPTKGRIEINGRVSSLLEVGTGFHPELTGHQNVYLNGTILGMTRNEIKAKFDEIVAFSGVEKFINTPVKHYSSGMKVRLAFSVAAHLEPEILIIDEVLAVGDAEFQKKCLGKMEDVTGEGRTVLFVSHNMAAVEKLCSTSILLKGGNLIARNEPKKLIDTYLNQGVDRLGEITERKGNQALQVKSLQIANGEGVQKESYKADERIVVSLEYDIIDHDYDFNQLVVGVGLKNTMGDAVFLHHNRLTGFLFKDDEVKSSSKFEIVIDNLSLNGGIYSMHYSVMQGVDYIDHSDNVANLEIGSSFPFNYREFPSTSASKILVNSQWSIK